MKLMLLMAAFLKLTFTSPTDMPHGTRVERYEGQRSADGGRSWTGCLLWARASTNSGPPVPSAAGTLDSAFVSVSCSTMQWLAGGEVYAVVAVDSAGNRSAPSNRVAVACGPDTVWMVVRAPGARPVSGLFTAGKGGSLVGVRLAPDDTAGVWLKHYESVVLDDGAAVRAAICRIYGYWMLRGTRQACP